MMVRWEAGVAMQPMTKGLAQVLFLTFLTFLTCHTHTKRSGKVGQSTQSDCVCRSSFRSPCLMVYLKYNFWYFMLNIRTGNGVVSGPIKNNFCCFKTILEVGCLL